MGDRVAEVHEEPVTKQLSDMAIVALDNLGTHLLICPHHVTPVFRVELRGQFGRIDQVTEQHSELAAFGVGRTWDLSSSGGWDIRHRWRLVRVVVLGRTL
jgi:hypothetical protein